MMVTERPLRSADIIALRPDRQAGNIFTFRDRLDVVQWQAIDRGGVRIAIHKRDEADPPEVGEFASIYLAGNGWAVWCAAREGQRIKVWRACDGRDLGWFETMRNVLAKVSGWAKPLLLHPGIGPCSLGAAGRAGQAETPSPVRTIAI